MEPTEKALFHIDYEGRWFHDGAEIKRPALARLFAEKGLRIDESGRYWLQSPESRYPVDVEDVPFMITDYDIQKPGPDQVITLVTNMGERVVLGQAAVFELRPEPHGGVIVPYIHIRRGLYARLSRAVYYKLIATGIEKDGMICQRSSGMDHSLGLMNME